MTDTLIVYNEIEAKKTIEAEKRFLKKIGAFDKGNINGKTWGEMADNLRTDFVFKAEGQRFRVGDDLENLPGYELATLPLWFEHIINAGDAIKGDEVYLIHYEEGLILEGWIVVYDADKLFSKVFIDSESITDAVGEKKKEGNIMIEFRKILDKNGIRYDEDHMVWD